MILGNIRPGVEGADPTLLAETLGPECLKKEVGFEMFDAIVKAQNDLRQWSADVESGVLTDNEEKARALEKVTKSLKDALELQQDNEGAPVDEADLARALKNVARALQKELAAY